MNLGGGFVMSSQKNHVNGWFEEKVVLSLREMAASAYWLKELEGLKIESRLSGSEKERYELALGGVLDAVYAGLYDLTKVASDLHALDKWQWKDRDEIFENGDQGLARILDKYGFSAWLSFLRLRDLIYDRETGRKISEEEILKQVSELSNGPRENRTLIYDQLRMISHNSKAQRLLDLIEPVTQGEKDWPIFQSEVVEVLNGG